MTQSARPVGQEQPRAATRLQYLATLIVLTGVYFVAGKLGLKLASVHPSASPVWPPTGVALAALLIFGLRVWPAILVGAFLVNLTTAGTLATSLGIAAGNTLEGLAGAFLVTLAANGRRAFDRTGDLFRFGFFAGILATTVSATIGVTTLSLGGFAAWSNYPRIWLTWWLGDAMGAFIVAPVLILWSLPSPVKWNEWRVVEVAALFITLVLLGLIVFTQPVPSTLNTYPVKFLTFPFLLWAAIRFGQREAATAVAVLCGVAIWGNLHAGGPFVLGPAANEGLLLLQLFMAVMSTATLGVGTSMAERKRAEDALRDTLDKMEVKIQERTQALQESEKSLHELSARLLQLQDEERRRIAQELHENTGQKLAALSMNLSLAMKELEALSPKARQALLECLALAEQSVQEMRTLSYVLHPPFLDELGLAAALRWYAEGFSKRSGIRIEVDAPAQALPAPKDVETTMFRVVQECLTNIHRHAASESVRIRLYADAEWLRLEVEDQGRGVAVDREGTESLGVGLRGMRERVRQLDGRLEFNSSEQGTTVRVSLPYRRESSGTEFSAGAFA
jgi:signal transduction histidine kinase